MPGISRDEEDLYEEDIVFDQSGLLSSRIKAKTAVVRMASGKCFLFAKTATLCAAFFVLGLCIAIPGPTLLDFQHQVNTDVTRISYIFAARSLGYLLGSLIGGILFDRYNRQFLVFLSLLGTAIAVSVAPWCHVVWLLDVCMAIMGITMGFLDTGGNVLCLDLWGRNSGPFMQALHFSFGLGAFVAPLLAEPFLGPAELVVFNSSSSSNVVSSQYPIQISNFVSGASFHELSKRDDWGGDKEWNLEARFQRDVERSINSTLENNSTAADEVRFLGSSAAGEWSGEFPTDVSPTSGVITSTPSAADVLSSPATSTVKSKTPKPKPTFTDGSKLDKTQNWDKVPFRKPPPEDLVLPSTSTTTTTTTSTTEATVTSTVTAEATSGDNETDVGTTMFPATDLASQEFTTDVAPPESRSSSSTAAPVLTSQDTPKEVVAESVTTSSVEAMSLPPPTSTGSTETVHLTEAMPVRSSTADPVTTGDVFLDQTNQKRNKYRPNANDIEDGNYDNPNNNDEALFEHASSSHESDGNKNHRPSVTDEMKVSNLQIQEEENMVTTTTESITTTTTEKQEVHSTRHPHVFKPSTFDNDTEDRKSVLDLLASKVEAYGFNRFQTAYLIVGLLVFAVALVFLGFLCYNPREPRSKQEEGVDAKKVEQRFFRVAIVALMFVFFFLYVGMEVAFGQLLFTFAVHSDLHLSKSSGSFLTAIFWGSFAVMRFASIFCASGLSPTAMLVFNFFSCTTGTVILAIAANTNETALWVGSALVGVGMASVFPTGILWAERYIHVSNKVVAVFIVGASFGEMACPLSVGSFIDRWPMVLMYSVTVANLLCMLTFAAMWLLASRQGEKYLVPADAGYQLASQHDDDDDDMIEMSPASASVLVANHTPALQCGQPLVNGQLH